MRNLLLLFLLFLQNSSVKCSDNDNNIDEAMEGSGLTPVEINEEFDSTSFAKDEHLLVVSTPGQILIENNSEVVTSLGIDDDAVVSPEPPTFVTSSQAGSTPTTPDLWPIRRLTSTTTEKLPTSTEKSMKDGGAIEMTKLTTREVGDELTTTKFLDFIDPNFDSSEKYEVVPLNSSSSSADEQQHLRKSEDEDNIEDDRTIRIQPVLKCYICTNTTSTSCDLDGYVDEKTGRLSVEHIKTVGVALIECPPTSRSCGKLAVTSRYFINQQVKCKFFGY